MTPSGIETATLWLVAQCLNQLRHRVPPKFLSVYEILHVIHSEWELVLVSILYYTQMDNLLLKYVNILQPVKAELVLTDFPH